MKQIEITQVFQKEQDGNNTLLKTIEKEVDIPTQEEVIAEKEAELLKIYAELETLKASQKES